MNVGNHSRMKLIVLLIILLLIVFVAISCSQKNFIKNINSEISTAKNDGYNLDSTSNVSINKENVINNDLPSENFNGFSVGESKNQDNNTSSSSEVNIPKFVLSKTELSLYTGESEILTAYLNNNKIDVIWSSNDDTIATIDKFGKITTFMSGKIIISAVTNDKKYKSTCSLSVKFVPDYKTGQVNLLGNSVSNILNGGFAAQQGDWIYYRNDSDNGYLYKTKKDGAQKQKLFSDPASNINAIGEWIYYTYSTGNNPWGCICRVRTDGSEHKVLTDTSVYNLYLTSESAYFISESYKIIKMNLDGSAMTILNDVKSYNLIISEDSIYYCEESTNGFPFMRMTLDGKSKTKFFNGGANNYEGIYLANDIFYCISNGYITCYNKDGQLIANPANNIRSAFLNSESFCTNNGAVCLSDHTIYYIDYLTSPNFYKTDLAGGQKTLVKDTLGAYARNLNVIDGWIYYRVETDNNNYVLKRIRIDGTDMQYVN